MANGGTFDLPTLLNCGLHNIDGKNSASISADCGDRKIIFAGGSRPDRGLPSSCSGFERPLTDMVRLTRVGANAYAWGFVEGNISKAPMQRIETLTLGKSHRED